MKTKLPTVLNIVNGQRVKILDRSVFSIEIQKCKGNVFATVNKKNKLANKSCHELVDFKNEKGMQILPGLIQAYPKDKILAKTYIEVI